MTTITLNTSFPNTKSTDDDIDGPSSLASNLLSLRRSLQSNKSDNSNTYNTSNFSRPEFISRLRQCELLRSKKRSGDVVDD